MCILFPLVSAAKQNNHRSPVAAEIDAVARSPIDARFADAIAKKLAVAKAPDLQPFKPGQDTCPRLPIRKIRKPVRKRFIA